MDVVRSHPFAADWPTMQQHTYIPFSCSMTKEGKRQRSGNGYVERTVLPAPTNASDGR